MSNESKVMLANQETAQSSVFDGAFMIVVVGAWLLSLGWLIIVVVVRCCLSWRLLLLLLWVLLV